MTKYGVLTLWQPYEVFDTKEAALAYAGALADIGIHSLIEEENETD